MVHHGTLLLQCVHIPVGARGNRWTHRVTNCRAQGCGRQGCGRISMLLAAAHAPPLRCAAFASAMAAFTSASVTTYSGPLCAVSLARAALQGRGLEGTLAGDPGGSAGLRCSVTFAVAVLHKSVKEKVALATTRQQYTPPAHGAVASRWHLCTCAPGVGTLHPRLGQPRPKQNSRQRL